jgi:hypothetical protein
MSNIWGGAQCRALAACAGLSMGLTGLANAQAAAPMWRLELRTNRHSDVGPIAEMGGPAEGSDFRIRGSRNLAYMDDEVRLSRSSGSLDWSLLVRSFGVMVANRDALAAANHVEGTARKNASEQWNIAARMTSFTGAGAEVKLRLATQLPLTVSAQALALTRLRELSIDGPASFEPNSGTYSFDLHGDKAGGNLTFPFMHSYSRNGFGLLFGAETQWDIQPLQFRAALRDLGWLYWNDLPRQHSDLTTQTREVDANGFVIYKPALQGQNTQKAYLTRAVARLSGEAIWRLESGSALKASVDAIPSFGLLPAVAWRTRLAGAEVELGWRFHEQRAELAIDAGALNLRFGWDGIGKTRSRLLSIAYQRQF